MKFTTPSFFSFIILVSCQNPDTSLENSATIESAKIRNAFLPIITGDWVETSFMDTLKRTKSPYNSQDALANIVQFSIDSSNITADSMEIGAMNIHEGSNLIIHFRLGKLPTSLPLDLNDYDNKSNYYELGYTILNRDTTLVLYQYNANNKLISQTRYSKVPPNNVGAFAFTVNKTFFSGTYEYIDSTKIDEQVQFTNDGIVKGIPDYSNYYVLTDFVAETDSSTDEVCFNIQTNGQICYTYKFNQDTLLIYERIEDQNRNFIKLGDVKYVLLKKTK